MGISSSLMYVKMQELLIYDSFILLMNEKVMMLGRKCNVTVELQKQLRIKIYLCYHFHHLYNVCSKILYLHGDNSIQSSPENPSREK